MLRHPWLTPDLARSWARLRYAPILAQLVTIRRCNLACGYCTEFDERSPPVPVEALRARIDELAGLGALALELTGGEPLLHPELPALVAYARRHPFVWLGMITNGFLLTRATIEALNAAGLTNLQISVDGVHPNDVTVKVLKPLRPKLELLARHARFKIVLSAVVGSGAPFTEVAEVIGFARSHGFQPRVLLVHGANGQLALSPADLGAYRQVQRLIPWSWSDVWDYREALIRGGAAPFKCRAGSRYLYVDEHGVVHWCAHTRAAFGKPLADYTAADLERQWRTPKGCEAGCTVGCVRTASQADRYFPQPG